MRKLIFLIFKKFVLLIYSVLVSIVQQSDSGTHMYTFFFKLFFIMFYHRILNIVPWALQ